MNRTVCFRCDKPARSIFKMTPCMLKQKKAYDLIKANGLVSAICTFFDKEQMHPLN